MCEFLKVWIIVFQTRYFCLLLGNSITDIIWCWENYSVYLKSDFSLCKMMTVSHMLKSYELKVRYSKCMTNTAIVNFDSVSSWWLRLVLIIVLRTSVGVQDSKQKRWQKFNRALLNPEDVLDPVFGETLGWEASPWGTTASPKWYLYSRKSVRWMLLCPFSWDAAWGGK